MKRGWRHGPRYRLAAFRNKRIPPRPAIVWFIWDQLTLTYVVGPIAHAASARERVRRLNAAAGYGAITGPVAQARRAGAFAWGIRPGQAPSPRQIRSTVVAVHEHAGSAALSVKLPADAAFPSVGATLIVYTPGGQPQSAELKTVLSAPPGTRTRPLLVLGGIAPDEVPVGTMVTWIIDSPQ
jgi:hypothetical protein